MNIRARITFQFTFLVSIILILLAFTIYYFSADFRENEFFSRLTEKASTTARLFSKDVKEIDANLMKIIDKNSTNALLEEKVSIFDLDGQLIFGTVPITPIDQAMLHRIISEKEVQLKENEKQEVGILHVGKSDTFVVIVSAMDKYGLKKIRFLKFLLIIVVLNGILLTIIVGLFFSRQALSPIEALIRQVEKISISNLNLRVNEGNGRDEIAQLAIKFNQMLERLEASFETQRSFVANASHELRTPLTMLTGDLEVAMMNTEVSLQAKAIFSSLLEDIKQLNKLSNGLLDLAQASLDVSELKLEFIRVDELIGLVHAEVTKRNPGYKIMFHFSQYPENENWLTLHGNEHLLRSAFTNIIENACKYSGNTSADVILSVDEKNILVTIIDSGIGIAATDLPYIFDPFFRSKNAKIRSGHGIGLTLSQKIVYLHKGSITVLSELDKGTQVFISLPHV